MDIVELLKIAADWSLAAVLAGVLVWVIKTSDQRQQEMVDRLVDVIGKNTQALAEIKPALENITRFMDAMERRLAAIESRLERLARGGETF